MTVRLSAAALIATATIVSAAPAVAADLIPAPIVTPTVTAYDWTGMYVGGHLGYGWSDVSGQYDNDDVVGPSDLSEFDLEGLAGGFQVGYNHQIGSWVFGIEGDTTWFDAEDDILGIEPPNRGPDDLRVDIENLTSLRGRLGWAYDRFMIFGTAGYGWSDYEFVHINAFNGTRGEDSPEGEGAVYGGGAEWALSDFLTVRAEYLHYDVGTSDFALDTSNSDADAGDFISFDDVDVVRATVNLRLCSMGVC